MQPKTSLIKLPTKIDTKDNYEVKFTNGPKLI